MVSLPILGISWTEILRGALRFLDAPSQPRAARLELDIVVTPLPVAPLVGELVPVAGRLDCEGFDAGVEVEGTVSLDLWRRRGIGYVLRFSLPEVGEVELHGWRYFRTPGSPREWFPLHARLEQEGRVIATGALSLLPRDAAELVRSIRPYRRKR
jgi:hypothetical protein